MSPKRDKLTNYSHTTYRDGSAPKGKAGSNNTFDGSNGLSFQSGPRAGLSEHVRNGSATLHNPQNIPEIDRCSSALRDKETVCYFHTSTLPTRNLKLRGSVKVCVGREITGDSKSLEIWRGNKFRFNSGATQAEV